MNLPPPPSSEAFYVPSVRFRLDNVGSIEDLMDANQLAEWLAATEDQRRKSLFNVVVTKLSSYGAGIQPYDCDEIPWLEPLIRSVKDAGFIVATTGEVREFSAVEN